jgi:hypothetical protein
MALFLTSDIPFYLKAKPLCFMPFSLFTTFFRPGFLMISVSLPKLVSRLLTL